MRFVIVGCGRHGSELARLLLLGGHELVVIDRDPASFARLPSNYRGATLPGVGFDRRLLQQAQLEWADGLAAVTGDDRVNFVVARVARQVFRVPRVVARADDPRRAQVYRRLGIPTVAPVTWAVQRMADVLSPAPLEVVYSLGAGDADLVEAEVPAHWVGRTVEAVAVPGEISVVAVLRGGATLLAVAGLTFQPEDRFYALVAHGSSARLADLLHPP